LEDEKVKRKAQPAKIYGEDLEKGESLRSREL